VNQIHTFQCVCKQLALLGFFSKNYHRFKEEMLFPVSSLLEYISINCTNVIIRMQSVYIHNRVLEVNRITYFIKLCT